MIKIVPTNTTADGLALTIVAEYFKSGATNLIGGDRGGRKDGFMNTGVSEYEEGQNRDDAALPSRVD